MKDVGSSQPQVEQTTPVVNWDDAQIQAAAKYVGRRMREMAREHDQQAIYREFIIQSNWDIDYGRFQRIMEEVINSQQDNLSRIVQTFAGALHISEVVLEIGSNLMHRNEYLDRFAKFVGKFINDQGLMPWIEQQGGWVS